MMRNYLKGTLGDAINTMMAAAAYNMRHWMNKNALSFFVSWLLTRVRLLENMNLKMKTNMPAATQLSQCPRNRGLAGLTIYKGSIPVARRMLTGRLSLAANKQPLSRLP